MKIIVVVICLFFFFLFTAYFLIIVGLEIPLGSYNFEGKFKYYGSKVDAVIVNERNVIKEVRIIHHAFDGICSEDEEKNFDGKSVLIRGRLSYIFASRSWDISSGFWIMKIESIKSFNE